MSNIVSPYAWILDHGGQEIWSYLADEENIMCRICRYKCSFSPPSRIKRHLESSTHIRNVDIYRKHLISHDTDSLDFNSDLTKMLVSCNIPLATVDHPNFSKFMQKYAGKPVPCRKTVDRLVEAVSKDVISKIKQEVEGKDIFIAIDETKDNRDRSMTAILIGPLDGYFLYRPYLINLTEINISNVSNITNFVVQSIQVALGKNYDGDNVKLFITDGAPHCKRAGEDLQGHYPQLEHVTSLAHGLYNVDELENKETKTNELIAEVNEMFLNARPMKRSFITMMKSVHTSARSRLTVNSLRDLLIIKWNSRFTDL